VGRFQPGENEIVHWRAHEPFIFYGRDIRFPNWLEGPMRTGLGPNSFKLRNTSWRGARVRRSHFDPRFKARDLSGGELFVFGRHPQIVVRVTDRLDQKALLNVAGFDGGAGIASFQHALARIQEQAALDLALCWLWHE